MYKKFNWAAFTNDDRHQIIQKIRDTIFSGDAYILNFNMYSDLELSLNIEVEERYTIKLFQSLQNVLTMSDQNFDEINSKSKSECTVYLKVSFGKGTGDLRNIVPDVPG